MPPITVPNSAQVRILWAINGQLGVNVLGAIIQGSQPIDQALADSLGAAMKSSFTTNLATHYPQNTGIVRIGVRDVRTANMPEYLDTTAAASGSGITEGLPRQTAFCVTFRTARAGKSFRGRAYLPAPLETVNEATGQANTAFQSAALAFFAAVAGNMASNGLQHAVLSRSETARTRIIEYKARAAQATPVLAAESRNINWETQRRRGNAGPPSPTILLEGTRQVLSY